MNHLARTASLLCLVSCSLLAQRTLGTTLGIRSGERFGSWLRNVGDVNADGYADWIGGTASTAVSVLEAARVISGKDGSVLYAFQSNIPGSGFGMGGGGVGDIDKDGYADFALTSVALVQVNVYSGKTGGIIVSFPADVALPGRDACGLGDTDADGYDDFAYLDDTSNTSASAKVFVVSGKTRTIRYSVLTGGGLEQQRADNGMLRALGDLDNDGVTDFCVSKPKMQIGTYGVVRVFSGKNGALLRQIQNPVSSYVSFFGAVVGPAGDIDRDGTPDLIVTAREEQLANSSALGAVRIYSGKTWAVLRTIQPPPDSFDVRFGAAACSPGDLDADGIPELAIGSNYYSTDAGMLQLYSGRTNRLMLQIDGPAHGYFARVLEPAGDVDRDGIADLLLASTEGTSSLWRQGSVQVISGRLVATATNIGESCGQGPLLPTLRASRPLLGITTTILGLDAPVPAPGWLLGSFAPDAPLSLGVPGCALHVSPTGYVILHTVNGSASSWSTSLPLPPYQQYMGLELALQVIYGPTLGPIGVDLTNGVRLRLGY